MKWTITTSDITRISNESHREWFFLSRSPFTDPDWKLLMSVIKHQLREPNGSDRYISHNIQLGKTGVIIRLPLMSDSYPDEDSRYNEFIEYIGKILLGPYGLSEKFENSYNRITVQWINRRPKQHITFEIEEKVE